MGRVDRTHKTILLVAGGTGGHILPAISFGAWLNQYKPEYAVRYLTGSRPLEREIYQASEVTPLVMELEGSPMGVSGLKSLGRWWRMIRSLFQARRIIAGENPVVCVLFGGYISLPVLLACRLGGIPAALHEQNARAGRVTGLAHRLGVLILCGWSECVPLQKGEFTEVGVPIRPFEMTSRSEAWERLQVGRPLPAGPIVLVLSGSLGSANLRAFVDQAARSAAFKEWTFILMGAERQSEGANVIELPKRWDIAPLYGIADVAIARAGASTLFELMLMGIPALLLPWMESSGGHQLLNARLFEKMGCGVVWDEKNSELGDFYEKLHHLLKKNETRGTKNDQSMYNKVESICEKLWQAVLSVI